MTVTRKAIGNAIRDLAPEYGIGRALLFGSYARGEQTDSSDVDLVIELQSPLGFKRGRMCLELESRLGCHIDLVFGAEQLYPLVRRQFEQDNVVVYER